MLDMIDREQLRDWIVRLIKIVRDNKSNATDEVMTIAKEMDQVYLDMLSELENE